MRLKPLSLLVVLVGLLSMLAIPVEADSGGHRKGGRHDDDTEHAEHSAPSLADIRQATARYSRIDNAIEDGYVLGYNGVVTGCIAHPTDGAMGYHYFDAELMEDPEVDPLRPEGLVYEPGPDGRLRLGAVEWVVPSEVWATTGSADPPSVLGIDLHVLNPVLGWYIHHAWIWKYNPSGVFADWNPRVHCPQ